MGDDAEYAKRRSGMQDNRDTSGASAGHRLLSPLDGQGADSSDRLQAVSGSPPADLKKDDDSEASIPYSDVTASDTDLANKGYPFCVSVHSSDDEAAEPQVRAPPSAPPAAAAEPMPGSQGPGGGTGASPASPPADEVDEPGPGEDDSDDAF
eukprot:NODE_1277_length_632_cov_722.612350_g1006_i0.p1 GENE.NODE_1277_length_632_cov_722.612350_g1006_i0~~NODE_1277_length_632_cov_722.612350_g1006_i0.p1  ORF type:complete len:160 (+),score=48.99 NODE_1277_length_632_cov_722.612350_g1006_i0:27-482(+)